ncbi:TetR/AcrR family transcriptional regulator [Solirubrobacter soli]|uniref:TetR/AcrR family transcriptional regulator n=1 Tax=Solirubrobacter soli TaxID=363832 RepID=UPI0003FF0FC3|nr:TetR/AcrR family transcriptional regulator [Solirubrobacter soli]
MPGEGRKGPRPRGTVRSALVDAGVELARSGGPDAVVLREVTRMVGVVPNAAYRHFADRDALLAAVRDEAIGMLAERMSRAGAPLELQAVGDAYLEFARTEPGLFDTAFAAPDHPARATPLEYLRAALDHLVDAGVLAADRRPDIEYPIWAAVHGLAVLLRGPLQSLPDAEKTRLEQDTLAFIGAAVT